MPNKQASKRFIKLKTKGKGKTSSSLIKIVCRAFMLVAISDDASFKGLKGATSLFLLANTIIINILSARELIKTAACTMKDTKIVSITQSFPKHTHTHTQPEGIIKPKISFPIAIKCKTVQRLAWHGSSSDGSSKSSCWWKGWCGNNGEVKGRKRNRLENLT